METENYSKLSNIILDNPANRYCEIYKIINLVTKKKKNICRTSSISYIKS